MNTQFRKALPGTQLDYFDAKEAVEAIYDKKVVTVNTINVKGKTKRWKGKPYKRNDLKKAIVTLAEGEMIDITSGI